MGGGLKHVNLIQCGFTVQTNNSYRNLLFHSYNVKRATPIGKDMRKMNKIDSKVKKEKCLKQKEIFTDAIKIKIFNSSKNKNTNIIIWSL